MTPPFRLAGDLKSRLAWGLVLAALCYAVLRIGVGAISATSDPTAALRIAPNNAAALTAQSVREFEPITQPGARRAADLARAAFAREPVAVIALRQLGFASEALGQADRASALVASSESLSRRDFIGQLWLIENAVNRNDVPAALRHYDVALRSSKRASSILFGPLTLASADPAMVRPLGDMLATRPPWGNFYLLQAASASTAPRNMVRIITRLARSGYPVTPLATQSLSGRLIQSGDYTAAWALYAGLHPKAQRDGVRDAAFTQIGTEGLPFDWTYDTNGSASAVLIDDRAGTRLAYDAPVGTGGVVVRQLLMLSPGRYRLSSLVVDNNTSGESAPAWRLRCADRSRDLGALPLPIVQDTPKRIGGMVTISGCKAQWLELSLTATEDPDGIAGAVKNVAIERVPQGV